MLSTASTSPGIQPSLNRIEERHLIPFDWMGHKSILKACDRNHLELKMGVKRLNMNLKCCATDESHVKNTVRHRKAEPEIQGQ